MRQSASGALAGTPRFGNDVKGGRWVPMPPSLTTRARAWPGGPVNQPGSTGDFDFTRRLEPCLHPASTTEKPGAVQAAQPVLVMTLSVWIRHALHLP